MSKFCYISEYNFMKTSQSSGGIFAVPLELIDTFFGFIYRILLSCFP